MPVRTRVVNMIPQSQSNESNDDSETNIALNPADPRIIAATAFTATPTAVIFLTSDHGETWAEAAIVPPSTNDYNAKFSRNALYCGDLVAAPLAVFTTTDPFSGAAMVQIDGEPNIDQPWMGVETVRRGPDTGKDRVYAGYTNWNGVTSVATIDVSQDGTVPGARFHFGSPPKSRRNSKRAVGADRHPRRRHCLRRVFRLARATCQPHLGVHDRGCRRGARRPMGNK